MPPEYQPWFMLLIIICVFAGLLRGYAADVVILGAAVLCALVGIIGAEEAFEGFSNKGMLTVAALYVVAAGLRETGGINFVGSRLFAKAKTEGGVLRRMAFVIAPLSAFMNNTPIVAIFIPIITKWCRDHSISPSRFLMFLSFVSIFGGMCTLIGTSTNIIVNNEMKNLADADPTRYADLKPMSLFELAWIGIPLTIAGVLYLMTIGRKLLPTRSGTVERMGLAWREYLVNMRVQEGCGLIGKSVTEGGLRHLQGLFLIEVTRENEVFSPVSPDFRLEADDILTFTGAVETIVDLQKIPGLLPFTDEEEADAAHRRHRMMCEAVVSSSSPLIGKNVRASNFRARYNAAVIAVHRGRQRLKGRVGDIVIQNGDTLLLQAGANFSAAHRNNTDFFLVGDVEDSRAVRHERATVSLVLLGVLVLLAATQAIPLEIAAFLVAGLMVVMRCLSSSVAHQSVDIRTLVTIAAAFGLGKALVASGSVDIVVSFAVGHMEAFGPYGLLSVVLVATVLCTSIITNNAAAFIMFEFAIAIAMDIGVSPRPFAIAVAIGASSCFFTPMGYQTNLMVYGPGGYKFSDFLRVGLPLNVLVIIIGVLLLPLIWPFHPAN